MPRPITLCTAQWADLPLEITAKKAKAFGYEGLELACWGDHFDVFQGAKDKRYCEEKINLLAKHGLKTWAISNHLAGQLICDPNNDSRSDGFAPASCAGDADKKRQFGVDSMKAAARAAQNLGVSVVNGFTGSSIWQLLYSFPPTDFKVVEEGYAYFAAMFNPILDVFEECGVRFALEVHPTEIAYDIVTTKRVLEALNYRKSFGFNFDPSHLQWQGIDPVKFIEAFPDRIYHVHMKDAAVTLDGRNGILGSHLPFGDLRRGWNFRSPGHGDVAFEEIIRELNGIGYEGPLSVEWEDNGMDREQGAAESLEFVRSINFSPSSVAFDKDMKTK